MHHTFAPALTVASVLALSLAPPAARAELPPAPCLDGGWIEDAAYPLALAGLPSDPSLSLPVNWEHPDFGVPGPLPDLAIDARGLSVEVRDGADALVPGSVAFPDPDPELAVETARPRWRPDAPLVAGARYRMRVVVAARGPRWRGDICAFAAVAREVTLDVAAAPVEIRLNLAVTTRDSWGGGTSYHPCGLEPESELACPNAPGVCCAVMDETRYRAVEVMVTASEGLPGGALHHRVAVRHVTPGGAEGWPASPFDGAWVMRLLAVGPVLAGDAVEVGEHCADGVWTDLMTGAVHPLAVVCADPVAHVDAGPAPVPECLPALCAELQPPDVGPEAGPEASPEEVPVVDAGLGGLDAVVEAGAGAEVFDGPPDAGAVEVGTGPDGDWPAGSATPEGCGGGLGGGMPAIGWAGAVLAALWGGGRRRRGR